MNILLPVPNFCKNNAKTNYNGQYWRKIMQKYRNDEKVRQIMLVRYIGGYRAITQFYTKKVEENNAWSLLFEECSYIGKKGIGKTREGDGKTPVGDYGVKFAFGIRHNPGTSLKYININKTTYACSDFKNYNQIIDVSGNIIGCRGEEMFAYSPEYNYGLFIDYNKNNIYGRGSSVFVHCKGCAPFTEGCVALGENNMKKAIITAEKEMRVVIGKY
ncbi:MAG: hypothetical protein IJQ50_07395 [Clostridia bacterium]|nr:hypothetical protein [Clostridia bacterium]